MCSRGRMRLACCGSVATRGRRSCRIPAGRDRRPVRTASLALRIAAALLRHRPAWSPEHLAALLRDQHRRPWRAFDGDRDLTAVFDLSYPEPRPTHQRFPAPRTASRPRRRRLRRGSPRRHRPEHRHRPAGSPGRPQPAEQHTPGRLLGCTTCCACTLAASLTATRPLSATGAAETAPQLLPAPAIPRRRPRSPVFHRPYPPARIHAEPDLADADARLDLATHRAPQPARRAQPHRPSRTARAHHRPHCWSSPRSCAPTALVPSHHLHTAAVAIARDSATELSKPMP